MVCFFVYVNGICLLTSTEACQIVDNIFLEGTWKPWCAYKIFYNCLQWHVYVYTYLQNKFPVSSPYPLLTLSSLSSWYFDTFGELRFIPLEKFSVRELNCKKYLLQDSDVVVFLPVMQCQFFSMCIKAISEIKTNVSQNF